MATNGNTGLAIFLACICQEVIVDSTNKKSGHDSIHCDSQCTTWIHRGCADLSKAAASESDSKFLCPMCRLHEQAYEIASLTDTVTKLFSELAQIEAHLSKNPSCVKLVVGSGRERLQSVSN